MIAAWQLPGLPPTLPKLRIPMNFGKTLLRQKCDEVEPGMHMSLSPELKVGLKEWASVCSALASGRQMVLLRKGGIHESDGEFELEHPQFLLFPTYLHQNLRMLKSSEHADFEPASSEPSHVTLSLAGEVTSIIQLHSRRQADALDAEHIWTAPLIDMRFDYRPQNPLYLLLVRAYRLMNPITVEITPAYAGCKSWVPLEQSLSTADVRPALALDEFERRSASIHALLARA